MSHPYRMTQPGFHVRRGEDWRGDNEIWRRLEFEYPPGLDSHCHCETFYIDDRGLIRRHDYLPDVFTEARLLARLLPIPMKAAHFTCRHREVDGLIFPTFRRVMLALPGHRPIPGLTMICAQLSDIQCHLLPTRQKPNQARMTPTEAPSYAATLRDGSVNALASSKVWWFWRQW